MASFVKNINDLADKLTVIESANEIFDEGVIPILEEIAVLDLDEAVDDLKKGNYLGNRKLDIDLALNVVGIDQDMIDSDVSNGTNITRDTFLALGDSVPTYSGATITFNDGHITELPFLDQDGQPVYPSLASSMLGQFTLRNDIVEPVAQVHKLTNIVPTNNSLYSITITSSGVSNTYSYKSDVDTTVSDIVTNLNALIGNVAGVAAFVDATDNGIELTMTARTPGEPFTTALNPTMIVIPSLYDVTLAAINPSDDTVYSVTITMTDTPADTATFSIISGAGATTDSITAALVAEINLGTLPVTASTDGTNILLEADVAETPFIATVVPNMELVETVANVEAGTTLTEFEAYETGSTIDTAASVPYEILRVYDNIGDASNIERIELHVHTGNAIDQNPIYYWGKTTSSFQTLSMRAGEIIKLGNEIDNLISLSTSISELLELQERIPELVDTYDVNGNPQGDITLYNRLAELNTLYNSLPTLDTLYAIRANITTVADNVADVNTVATDIASVNIVATDINNVNTTATNIASVNTTATNIANVNTVATDITNVNTTATSIADVNTIATDLDLGVASTVKTVSADLLGTDTIGTVAGSIANVNLTGGSIASINAVAANEANINAVNANETNINSVVTTVVPNIAEILLADDNAATATAQAGIATTQAGIATAKANEIIAIDGTQVTQTLASGSLATAYYNAGTGKFTFGIPQGIKGDRGDAFEVNAVGLLSTRNLYDGQSIGFSFLAVDTAEIYFKLSNTSGDWSVAAPFGKGETGNGIDNIAFTSTTATSGLAGEAGETDTYTITYTDLTVTTFIVTNGLGIDSILFTSTTDVSGLVAQSGATDTYTITYSDATTDTIQVYNGLDSAVLSVAGRTGDVVLTKTDVGLDQVDNTSDATKNSATATLTNKTLTSPVINAPTGIVKADVGLANVDNTSDLNKPISTATQAEIDSINNDINTKAVAMAIALS